MLHNVIGVIVTLLTLITCFQMYAKFDWEQRVNVHGILGMLCMVCSGITGISGLVTVWVMFRAQNQNWTKIERVTKIARIHRITGYVMLIFGNAIVSGGITTYCYNIGIGAKSWFGFVCLTVWIAVSFVMEKRYRTKHLNTYHFDKLPKNWK